MKFFDDNNIILGLDPGEKTHGVVVFNTFHKIAIYSNPKASFSEVEDLRGKFSCVLIEDFDSIHGNIGLSSVETIKNIGRFQQIFVSSRYMVHLIGRKHIINKLKCKNDSEILSKMKLLYPSINFKELKSHSVSVLAMIYVYESL